MTGAATPTAREPVARELMSRIEALPISRWHYTMVLLTGAALIFDTADAGIMSAAQVGVKAEFNASDIELGLLVSAAFTGATVSAALIGFFAERFGRRPMIALGILLFTLATAAAALSQNLSQLLVFRVIAGIGYGGLLPMAWAFGSEFAPAASRGRTLAWLNAFYGGGGAVAYLIGLAIIVPFGWRWGFAAFLIPALLALAILRLMPEGIPFLIRRGRVAEARAEVERIEAIVLRGRPRPEAIVDESLAHHDDANLSILAATKQLFGRGNLGRSLSILMAWPVPVVLMQGVLSFYPLIFTRDLGMPLPQVLAFLTFSGFLTIVGRFLAGIVLDPVRQLSPSGLKLFLAAGVVMIGGIPFVVLAGHWGATEILVLLCAQYLLQGLWAGCAMTYIPTVLPIAVRNPGLGLFSALTNLAQIIGPTLVGAILQFGGLQTAISSMLAVTLISAAFVAVFGHREQLTRAAVAVATAVSDERATEPVSS